MGVAASSASAPTRYAPTDKPRIAVAGDGTLAAIVEPARVAIVELPSCAKFAELALDGDAHNEVVWVGAPPRLLVLARHVQHTTIQLVDPFGTRTIADVRFDSALRLGGAVGATALVLGAQEGAVVLAATQTSLTSHPFPARALPLVAGAAGEHLVVALGGGIEEWDLHGRLPKRRLKLATPSTITALGGTERTVWLTCQERPDCIDVLPFDRSAPSTHDLPEAIAHVASHPRSDLVACIGASSGRMWVLDLSGRTGLRMIGPQGIDRVEAVGLVHGTISGVLAAQTKKPVTVVSLSETAPAMPRTNTLERVSRSPRPRSDTLASDPTSVHTEAEVAYGTFRERVRASTEKPAEATSYWPDASPAWRDELVSWTRAVLAGDLPPTPASQPIDAIVLRHELLQQNYAAVALLYGSHLVGIDGAAPVDIARVAGWHEALGRGDLYARGIAIFANSRVRLAPALTSVLDELPPLTGVLLGAPGAPPPGQDGPIGSTARNLLGPCSLVAQGPLSIVAEAVLPSLGGAILAAHDGVDPYELIYEARAYGAAPMVRVTTAMLERVPTHLPIILVVDDEQTAEALGLPRLN